MWFCTLPFVLSQPVSLIGGKTHETHFFFLSSSFFLLLTSSCESELTCTAHQAVAGYNTHNMYSIGMHTVYSWCEGVISSLLLNHTKTKEPIIKSTALCVLHEQQTILYEIEKNKRSKAPNLSLSLWSDHSSFPVAAVGEVPLACWQHEILKATGRCWTIWTCSFKEEQVLSYHNQNVYPFQNYGICDIES